MIPGRLLLLALSLGLAVSCGRESPVAPKPLPSWLTSLMRQLESEPVANPPGFIARYEYKREVVYYVPPRCCDIASAVYRGDGTLLCQPEGGLAGTGDGRCADFVAERKNEQIIWRDPRGSS